MITPQIQVTNSSSPTYLVFNKPITTTSLHGGGGSIYPSFRVRTNRPISFPNHRRCNKYGLSGGNSSKTIKAVAMTEEENKKSTVKVKATIRVQPTVGGIFSEMAIERGLDDITDLFGKSLLLELVSSTLHQTTALEKETISGYAHRTTQTAEEVKYEAELLVPSGFGEIGAIFVENEHRREMFIKDIVLDGFETGPLRFSCDSWVHSKFDNPVKRLFFTNKSYLPSETPEGLKRLRGEELQLLRGNGHGERKSFDRIYDYDVYNDLGDPDIDVELKRPVLGGKVNPYPRRCRTGRPRSKADPLSEERSSSIYVPRDESFSEVKQLTFSAKTVYSVLHAVVPAVQTAIVDRDLGFELFSHIDDLFHEGIGLPPSKNNRVLRNMLPRLIKFIDETQDDLLRFEPPAPMDRDRFFWFRDEEFGRQTLAGLNPCCIQLVTEWPLKSKLDPSVYGPAESAITKEVVEKEIRGFCTVEEAIQAKKLFVLDYHDLLLPVVEQVRELQGTTLYGSRALFFLTPEGTLRPLAIELVRPPINGKPQWKQVYTPTWHSTGVWLWRLAKAHLLAHDSGYHQLVSHWLRTHCCTEPYIIATNRQLSAMHPIYRLLNPHFRYTMEINALAREALINADGIIETSFTPKKYSILLSSIAYDKHWQFNLQSLPNDLIHRGMAVKDDNAPHGLRLTIEDYPYANDGLILWDALKGWITDYVDRYYSDSDLVRSDEELQAWWHEIKNVGHGDKKDEPWWPLLNTKEDLVQILTTIVWIASGHHAAVNFGQYDYAGYFPNRPTIARKKMPTEEPTEEEWEEFMEKPEMALLKCFPSQIQATTIMAVLDILSSHSPEEEYLGETIEPSWEEDPIVKGAFEKFKGKLLELEGEIDRRNADRQKKNRNGAGMLPYQLLKPVSEPGVTGKGVPYSISI